MQILSWWKHRIVFAGGNQTRPFLRCQKPSDKKFPDQDILGCFPDKTPKLSQSGHFVVAGTPSAEPISRSTSLRGSSRSVDLRLDRLAPLDQLIERQSVLRQQAISLHRRIVDLQLLEMVALGRDLELPLHGGVVVDPFAVRSLEAEEQALVVGDLTGEIAVGHADGNDAFCIEPLEIVPMPRIVIGDRLRASTEDMHGYRLLPERPLRLHHPRFGRRQVDIQTRSSAVANDVVEVGWLPRRASAKFQKHGGFDVAMILFCVANAEIAAFDLDGRLRPILG